MGLKCSISTLVSQYITSVRMNSTLRQIQEIKRKITQQPHVVTFYCRIDDPYSFILLSVLKQFSHSFTIRISLKIVFQLPDEMYPEPKLLSDYAFHDYQRLLAFHNMESLSTLSQPDTETCQLANQILLSIENNEKQIEHAYKIFNLAWQGNIQALKAYAENTTLINQQKAFDILQQREQNIIKQGHYLSGTLHYGGEWYWGIDRLGHLVDRLTKLGTKKSDLKSLKLNENYSNNYLIPIVNKQIQPSEVDFYFSFRSPYSYLALERIFNLANHYQTTLNIKLVLPMVMRGLAVPTSKRIYILKDAKREAVKNSIPFGKIADPLGIGVERCMALYSYAKQQGVERDYLLSISRGIWSRGVDVATDKGLCNLITEAGLDWQTAKLYLNNNDWRSWAESNRQQMLASGLWGVPSFICNNEAIWGQDRVWAVEAAIVKQATC